GAAAFACAIWLGCGAATASPSVTGKSYSDASSALQQAGFTPIVASVVGDKLSQKDCIVVAQHDRPNGMTGGWPGSATPNGVFVGAGHGRNQQNRSGSPVSAAGTNQVLVSLSCYAKDASPGVATGSGDINSEVPTTR